MAEISCRTMVLYVRFPLSLRNVEDLVHEGGIEVSHPACGHHQGGDQRDAPEAPDT